VPHTTAPDLAGWRHNYSGKVRDLYVPDDGSLTHLLVVASDRVSAFDHVLEPPIPGKGALLTALSRWWFDRLDVRNHLDGTGPSAPAEVANRAMVSRRLEMFPIECVVRGALTGSGYKEYVETGAVCGIELPAGIADGDLLPEPIYTPAYKAPMGEHDENITFERSVELVGEPAATALRDLSIAIFRTARDRAALRGIILADSKFEFGVVPGTTELVLADEVLTSDSSRYWDAAIYHTRAGSERLESFDKQIVRNWLSANWDGVGTPPKLPADIVLHTQRRYRELLERMTGD
jgi:phosphoribosylaminoimidazole-succinocarboxamide synthase